VLFDALRAFASAHVDIGYCQGMNYVAATILLTLYGTHPVHPPALPPDAGGY
jgi:hypothetical protein